MPGHEVRGTHGGRVRAVHQAAHRAVDVKCLVVALIEREVSTDQALELDADLALDDVVLGIEEVGRLGRGAGEVEADGVAVDGGRARDAEPLVVPLGPTGRAVDAVLQKRDLSSEGQLRPAVELVEA